MNNKKKSNAPRALNENKIRSMYNEGYSIASIARKFKCNPFVISRYVSDLSIPQVNQIRPNCSKLTPSQVLRIRKSFIEDGVSSPMLSTTFKVSETTILNVVHGIFYRWVPGKVLNRDGTTFIIPEKFYIDKPSNLKGRRKTGCKKGQDRMVASGVCKALAEKHGVSPSTISKWMRKGKMDTSGDLIKKGS